MASQGKTDEKTRQIDEMLHQQIQELDTALTIGYLCRSFLTDALPGRTERVTSHGRTYRITLVSRGKVEVETIDN